MHTDNNNDKPLKFPFGCPSQQAPKFKLGDRVCCPKTLHNEAKGEIVAVDRVYITINENGTFSSGLRYRESDIFPCAIPCDFDGDTLVHYYPETDYGKWIEKAKTTTAKFAGYAYTVQSGNMQTVFYEHSLVLNKHV